MESPPQSLVVSSPSSPLFRGIEVEFPNSPESYINDDNIYEILTFMPAKSVIKHSFLVSKSVLFEQQFIHKQTINTSHSEGGFFLQTGTFTDLNFSVLPTESPNTFGFPKQSLIFLQKKAQILHSTQGLVLFHDKVNDIDQFLICNPVTKMFAPIPYPDNIVNLIRFGDKGFMISCDLIDSHFPNDYTIIAPLFVKLEDDEWNNGFQLAIYRNGVWDHDMCDLRLESCWQVRQSSPVAVFNGPNKCLIVHYLCDSLPNALRSPVYLESYVAVYDMEKKVLWKKLKLPEGAWKEDGDHQKLNILKWGRDEKVGVVRCDGRRIVVWVLERYTPVKWRKVVDTTVERMGVPEEEGEVVGCSIANGVGLLFATWNLVYWYEMEGVNAGMLKVIGEHGVKASELGFRKMEFTPYANTLRPVCGDGIRMITV